MTPAEQSPNYWDDRPEAAITAELDTRTPQEILADTALLRCIGCIVARNNYEVPDARFTVPMFMDCLGVPKKEAAAALQRTADQDDSPLLRSPSTTIVYSLTESAKYYASPPLQGCLKIMGNVDSQEQRAKNTDLQKKAIDAALSSCLRCIVDRHPDNYEGMVVTGSAAASCLQISPQKAAGAMRRVLYSEKPPLTRARRGLPFTLTAEAANLEAAAVPKNCQKNTVVQPDETHLAQVASRKSRQLERLILCCVENVADPAHQKVLAQNITQLLEFDLIGIKRSRTQNAPPVTGYSDRGSLVYFSVGNQLVRQPELLQKTLLHYAGVDHLIYGEPVDTATLREELGMLPLDELSALAQLLLIKMGIPRDALEVLTS